MANTNAGSELPEPEETTDSRTKQQSALAELSQLALQSGELAGLLENSVGLVAEILQLRFCEVLEFQPSENQFILVCRTWLEAWKRRQCHHSSNAASSRRDTPS